MIVIADTDLEEVLKGILQERVDFIIDDKKWRSGKVLIFKQSGFFIEFLIETDIKQERFEVPIPFNTDIEIKNNQVIFDYTIRTFAHQNKEILDLISKLDIHGKSKFYDTKMIIKIHEISTTN